MTNKVCLKWCIKKWEWIVRFWNYCINKDENYDNLVKAIPRLGEFVSYCALCGKYGCGLITGINYDCPLSKIGQVCIEVGSIFKLWNSSCTAKNGKKYAQKMLDTLKKLYKKECKK
jgi:hypothetical protein